MRWIAIFLVLLLPTAAFAQPGNIDDAGNAQMLMMKARFLVGNQPTTSTPGQQTSQLNVRRGGPHAAHFQSASCGGVSIGNVQTVPGDHRPHKTTVLVFGHVYNSNNRCK